MPSKAEMIAYYEGRADEMRALAAKLRNKEHKRLLLEAAVNYDEMAKIEAKKR